LLAAPPSTRAAHQAHQVVGLGQRVHDDPADSGRRRVTQVVDGLRVAMHHDSSGIHPSGQRDGKFTARTHVERQAFLHHPLGHRCRQ
jgi:hypothetical protein